jgi:phosphoribosylanthranilate isomerase
MKKTMVKICGIKNIKTLEMVMSAGADYVGFVLDKRSKRFVSAEQIKPMVIRAKTYGCIPVAVCKGAQDKRFLMKK